MIWMPPGTAKSTYGSVIFPAWLMANRPIKVIGASNNLELALEFSSKVQDLVAAYSDDLGVRLKTENKLWWKLHNGSEYKAAGVGSGIQGIRADIAIIDDPVKGSEQVSSMEQRTKTHQWFKVDLYGRLKPDAAVIIIQTRWHLDDLSGRILDRLEQQELEAEGWEVINLPAIWEAAEDEKPFPDGMGRKTGELLWPEYHTQKFLDDKKAVFGPKDFACLFQQNPRPIEGALFQGVITKIEPEALPSDYKKRVRRWDIAATEKVGSANPDWTVGMLMQRNTNGGYVIVDVERFRGGPDEVRRRIREVAEADGSHVHIQLPQDPGASGKMVAHDFVKHLNGFQVTTMPETGSKERRAGAFAAQVNGGNVQMVKGAWNAALEDELQLFPNGHHDDQVDAASGAFGALIDLPRIMRRPTFGNHRMFER